jgi:putative endonuclease
MFSPTIVTPAKVGVPRCLKQAKGYHAVMPMEKHPAIYIMASRYRGTLYVGVTSDLWTRVCAHKNKTTPGFTSRHGVDSLVWYEHRLSMENAIRREKQIKAWKRAWKIRMIEEMNVRWHDLHDAIDVLSTLVEG